jgi:hypothetical protein
MKQQFRRLFVLAMTSLLFLVAESASAEEWEWTIAPYIWASDVELDLAINGSPVLEGDISAKDLIDKTDAAFMGHFEGRKGHWGMYFDSIFLKLSDDTLIPVGPGGPILGDLGAEAGMKLKLYELAGVYRFGDLDAATSFDLITGLRVVDLEVDVALTLPGPAMNRVEISTSPTKTDLLIGGRLIGNFSERWHWVLRSDYSFGGTQGTFNAMALVGYTFGQSGLFSLDLGYRYMSLDMKGTTARRAEARSKIKMSGPVLGFVFRF